MRVGRKRKWVESGSKRLGKERELENVGKRVREGGR